MFGNHLPAPSFEKEGGKKVQLNAPSSLEEGVGGGAVSRKTLLARAAEMRRNPAEPERHLWMELRDSRLGGHKFRRQVVIGWRIVDFFCPAKGLVIEIDGDTHDPVTDAERDRQLLRGHGFRTPRFSNLDVTQNLNGVLMTISRTIDVLPDRWSDRGMHHPPTPSSEEEGEKKAQLKAPSPEEEGGKKVQLKVPSSLEEGVGGGGG